MLFTSDCKTSEMELEAKSKTEEESWLTVLCCRRPNKVNCKNHSNTPGSSMHTFPKEAKRKQKWTSFVRIHRQAFQRNTLPCAPSILKHLVSAEVCLLRRQWISRGFCLEKDSLDIDYPRNEGSLANLFFPEERSFLWNPTKKCQYPKSTPPPNKKIDFSPDWVFEICFQSSEMRDPRPCPRG